MKTEDGSGSAKVIPVRVAVRIRPLNTRETREGCQECLDIAAQSPQIIVRGTEKAFTFDFTYASDSSQADVYETAVKNLVHNLFKGYNVTVVAYGQTGSGKTHTMGTAYTQGEYTEDEAGIIPRAVRDIFHGVATNEDCEFLVKVSFIELYKETLFDLLSTRTREECAVDIREDPKEGIKIIGLTEIPVTSLKETMRCLEQGALNRATGATAMNARSSRSHAIFSLHIEQRNIKEGESIISSKFHMVDLAGSERAKKTRATGERFKEGVNINKGLLALGNVISALCEEGNRGHIPYRDSKLTRLLQDSLGGNSHTVMIACVSPADSNLEETLSSLRYADRARKIKNKPIINRDPQAAELAKLRQQVQQLQVQLLSSNSGGGGAIASSDEVGALLTQNKMLQVENEKLARALHTAIDENTNMAEIALMAEMSRDRMKVKLEELRAQTGTTVEALNKTLDATANPLYEGQINLVKELQLKIIELQSDQRKGEKAMVDHELSRHNHTSTTMPTDNTTTTTGNNCENNEELVDPVSKEFGTEFTLRQAKLNEQLHDINKELAMKEELMNKMSTNDAQFLVMKASYEKEKKDLETHIDILAKEKDELMQQLKVVSYSSGGSKVSEQRRKRVQELETQITQLKQKQKEHTKLMRMKEQSEQKVIKLNSEIVAMKANRVKLIRQMKEDSEKFRVWKAQKDREVAKLKEADRRKEYQIVKLERLHSKKQNVLKRKMEEAIAINKRLKDAVALQKAGAEKRAASRETAGTGNRIRSWLEGELEVVAVKKQAKLSLESLVEDRKTISDQITSHKRQLRKRNLCPEMATDLEIKISDLENDLQLRTAQINDLQAKIVDGDEDFTSKKRFELIQSMIEAKCAMNYLFDIATNNQLCLSAREMDLKYIQTQYDEVAQSIEFLEAELETLKENHRAEVTSMERGHEEKVLFLLGHMPKAEGEVGPNQSDEDNALMERLKFQQVEIARLSVLHEELQAKSQECEQMKKQIDDLTGIRRSQVPFNLGNANNRHANVKPKARKAEGTDVHSSESDEEEEEDIEEIEAADEDEKDDPDWCKTPLFKKIKQITHGIRNVRENDENDEESVGKKTRRINLKRDSNGDTRCGCKGDCSKKMCACRKNASICNLKCKCMVMKCKNRSTPNSSTSDISKCDTVVNSTFDLTAVPLQERNVNKRQRLVTASLLDSSSGSENVSPQNFSNIKTTLDFLESPDLF